MIFSPALHQQQTTTSSCVSSRTVNFSYPSLEDSKPLAPAQPDPPGPEAQAPPAPPQVNGVAPSMQVFPETHVLPEKLPDSTDAPTSSSQSTPLDSATGPPAATPTPTPAPVSAAKATPQVSMQTPLHSYTRDEDHKIPSPER